MKRKVLAFILALMLCMSLAVRAVADTTMGETLTFTEKDEEWSITYTVSNARLSDEIVTMQWSGGEGEGLTAEVYYVIEGVSVATLVEGDALYIGGMGDITGGETGVDYFWSLSPPIVVGVGDYSTGSNEMLLTYSILERYAPVNYDNYFNINGRVFKFVDDLDSSAAEPIAQPPITPITPQTVNPTASTVYLNGEAIAFEAYNIGGYNFFKLRDLAYVLNGTEKQFEIGYDNDTRAIALTSGESYTAVGGEMAQGDGYSKTATPTQSRIYLDGIELNFTVYIIGGNNFFKLRDLMETIDVYVGYDNTTRAITLDTGRGYIAE